MEQELATTGLATIIWLLIAVMVVALASKYTRMPYTVALTIAGLIIAFTPLSVTVNLTPDLILFIFLPALLFESAYNLHFQDLRDNLRPIALLAVPGVVLTALCVAAGMHYVAGISWETAFLFGAIVSATDPVSVLAIFRRLGAPRRLSTIVEGESLFNDGTSLVIFRIVLGAVMIHRVGDVVITVEQFLVVVLGGLAFGLLVGYAVSLAMSRLNDYLVETTMTLVVAYGTYLAAERIGVSGVIALVVAAVIIGNYGRATAMSPTTRVAVSSSWEFFGFLANSLIFLLIGLELNVEKMGRFWLPTLLAIILVLIVRIGVVAVSGIVLRYVHRPLPLRWQLVLVWGGLRGSLSLAMALSLPFTIGPGQAFPDRDLLQVMTFGVILFSLLVQGMTVEPLLRKLGIMKREARQEEFEVLRVRRGMASAALAEIERMAGRGTLAQEAAQELREEYEARIAQLDGEISNLQLGDEDLRREHLRAARRRLVQIEKAVVRERNLAGVISEEPMRHVLSELDAQLYTIDSNQGDVIVEPRTAVRTDRELKSANPSGDEGEKRRGAEDTAST